MSSSAGDWAGTATAEFAAASVVFVLGAKALYAWANGGIGRGNRGSNGGAPSFTYVPFKSDYGPSGDDVVAVDCTHPSLPTLSHHKGSNNPPGLRPSDTSTGLVLNALQQSRGMAQFKRQLAGVMQRRQVTTNHFDVDSFLSVWCYINRQVALQHEGVLRHMARIGDFREAFLSPDLISAHGGEDRITFIREAYTALKLCCWINTLEARLFSAPYEAKDCSAKMHWFLGRFGRVLADPENAWGDWQQEYTRVVSGFDQLSGAECLVEPVPSLGLAVLVAPEPLHYVSLFSHTVGADVILSMYDGNRYEVECKYTQFVVVTSRPVWPRLDMAPLAAALNLLEAAGQQQVAAAAGQLGGRGDAPEQPRWTTTGLTDTGPLLRLSPPGVRMTKAQSYGHPCDRPIYSSTIPPAKMQAVVQSFLEYGLQGLSPRRGGFSWQELQQLNAGLNWAPWAVNVEAQHAGGNMSPPEVVRERLLRTRRHSVSSSTTKPADADGVRSAVQRLSSASPGGGDHGVPLPVGTPLPIMSQVSTLMSPGPLAGLAGVLPPLHQQRPWRLLYSTVRDGISMHTMLRKATGASPTVLVVRDAGHHVFGAFTAEPWRLGTRFYGTGETFVFQLEPRRVMYPYEPPHEHTRASPVLGSDGAAGAPAHPPRTDFFQYASHEGLGVGGAGHWALSLDEELARGSSGVCDTFHSPCLASQEDFEVLGVELWHIH